MFGPRGISTGYARGGFRPSSVSSRSTVKRLTVREHEAVLPGSDVITCRIHLVPVGHVTFICQGGREIRIANQSNACILFFFKKKETALLVSDKN